MSGALIDNRLLVDSDELVAKWVYTTYELFPIPVNKAIGIVNKQGTLVGGVLFQNYNGVNIEFSYYGPRTVTYGICKVIARIAIGHFNAARLTVVTSRRNKRLIRGLLRLGFKLEGVQRCFYGHQDNKKNSAVRLVAFKDDLAKFAYRNLPGKKDAV